jgi:putative oxidoreductase
VGVSLGIWTPVCCALLIAINGFSLFAGDATAIHCHVVGALLVASLALVGPGAYSIDSRLFGRRIVVIPSGEE